MLRRVYDDVITGAAFVAFSVMLGAAFLGTVSRYLTFLPVISWGEEVTRFAGIWAVFLVAGVGVRRGAHLGVDVLTRIFPPRARRLLNVFVHTLVLAFAGLLLIYGLRIAVENAGQYSAALEWPMGIVYLCIPIGAGLMIVETVGLLWPALRALPPPPIKEVAD